MAPTGIGCTAGTATTVKTKALLTFMVITLMVLLVGSEALGLRGIASGPCRVASLITQVPQQHPAPRQPFPRIQQSRMQLLLQLSFGWQFGPVLGHGNAVFVHLQQLHLFAAGLGEQDETDRR